MLALVLFAFGFVFWRGGHLEQRVAEAHEDLALLHYDVLDAEYGDIEDSMGLVQRLPGIGGGLVSDVQEHRAQAAYWQARYDTLSPQGGAPAADQEPGMMALSANAGFRAGLRDNDRQNTLRRIDAAIKSYIEILKKDPANADAAYNFEYLIRLRDTASKAKPAPPGKREDPAKAVQKITGVQMAGDLPDGRTVHGDPGAPPPNTDMTQFKMHIPVRPDERQGGSDAGQGKQKVRKG
jgi:hypothetical protein